jgi:ketosteroid isomerase-like protein
MEMECKRITSKHRSLPGQPDRAHRYACQVEDAVVEQLDRAASYFSDGRAIDFEQMSKTAADELGYTVEIERVETKVGGREEQAEFAARVTSVYRREEDGWKLIHRHADPRVSRQTAASVLQT